jgi:hypothetical protein
LFVVLAFSSLGAIARGPETPQACSSIVNEELLVDSRNDEWAPAKLKIGKGDLVMVFVSGTTNYSHAFNHEKNVTADGGSRNHGGRLQIKLGTGTTAYTGTRWVGVAPDAGNLKLRVAVESEASRDGWSGSYKVRVIVVPATALPPSITVEND